MRFALMEAKLGLANVVRRYTLLPSDKTVEPLQLDPQSAIAYVKDGLHIKVEKRFWFYIFYETCVKVKCFFFVENLFWFLPYFELF